MKRNLREALAVLLLFAPPSFGASPELLGTWELTYVAPQDIANTMPGGVTNTKLYFSADGKVFALQPDSESLEKAHSTTYTFDGRSLNLVAGNARPRTISVSFVDDDTMVFNQQFESKRTFRRISSFDKKLEPKSLQLVAERNGESPPMLYDERDYSALPLPDRMNGIWEVIAYENVPPDQIPPYGFFNDIWSIEGGRLTLVRREPAANDVTQLSYSNGQITSSGIGLGGPVGSRVEWKVTFDEWGHLVLNNALCRIVLKLVSKSNDTSLKIPLKIVLLKAREVKR